MEHLAMTDNLELNNRRYESRKKMLLIMCSIFMLLLGLIIGNTTAKASADFPNHNFDTLAFGIIDIACINKDLTNFAKNECTPDTIPPPAKQPKEPPYPFRPDLGPQCGGDLLEKFNTYDKEWKRMLKELSKLREHYDKNEISREAYDHYFRETRAMYWKQWKAWHALDVPLTPNPGSPCVDNQVFPSVGVGIKA